MQSIYTISPMIYTDTLPQRGEVGYVVSKYFYLFKVYHQSKEMIMIYMNYIDRNFDDVFTKLKLRIVQYDYPDEINYASGAMAEYINERYDLEAESIISVEHELNIESAKHYLFGKFEVMFNGFSVWEITQSGVGLFDDNYISSFIMELARYFTYETRVFLCKLAKTLYTYDEAIQELDNADYYHYDVFSNPYLDDNYSIFYELKRFVEMERREK